MTKNLKNNNGLKAEAYGPSSPIYRLAKKKRLNKEEHDTYLEVAKVGSEGQVFDFFLKKLNMTKKQIINILKSLLKKGLIKFEKDRFMANFAKAELTLASLKKEIEKLGIPITADNKIKKKDIKKALAGLNLRRVSPIKNYSFKPFGVDTWGKFYKKYKDQINNIVGDDNLFAFTIGTFGPINLKNRILLIDKEGVYYFVKLIDDELVVVNHGGLVVV